MQNDSRKSWRKRSRARMNNCLQWVFGKSDDEDDTSSNVTKVHLEEDRSENKRRGLSEPGWTKKLKSSSTTRSTSIRFLTGSAENSKNLPKLSTKIHNHPETSTWNVPSTSMALPRSLPKDLLRELNKSSPIKSLSSRSSARPAENSKNLLKSAHAPINSAASTTKEPSTSKTHRTIQKLKYIFHKYENSLPIKSSGSRQSARPSKYSKSLPKSTNNRNNSEPSTSQEPSTSMPYPMMFPQEIIQELKKTSPTKSLSSETSAWSANNLKNRSKSTNDLFQPKARTLKESSTTSLTQRKPLNLEEIIQEFEVASYTSGSPERNAKPQKFVKKIVEAMEEKYNTYNITRDGQKEKRRKLVEDEERMEASNVVENSKSNNFSVDSIGPNIEDEAEEVEEEEEEEEAKMAVKAISKIEKKRTIPKIVGAFLKRPIEVEETSVNWIPLPRNILPRKKSLRKIVNILSSKKVRTKLCSMTFASTSQKTSPYPTNNTMRGTPDSGFDDELSLSSFSSLTSISEALMQQEYIQEDPRKMTGRALTTFKPNNDPRPKDTADSNCNEKNNASSSSKLLLKDVPRSELPTQPVSTYIPKPSDTTVSLDRRPRRSMMYRQATFHQQSCLDCVPRYRTMPRSVRSNLSNVDRIVSVNKGERSSQSSSIPVYDVPRPHISLSESHLHEMSKYRRANDEEHVYDRPIPRPRPSSSLFEEAQSVKRRNECLELFLNVNILSEPGSDKCYVVASRYDTVKEMSKQFTSSDNLDNDNVEMDIEMWNMLRSDGFYRFSTILHR